MKLDLMFLINSGLLGIGLAMDAFSVSLANGLHEPKMKQSKMFAIAGTFGLFQGIMPMIGWICVHTIIGHFKVFERFIPWIAFVLLAYIGGKMILDGMKHDREEESAGVGIIGLLIQGIATSIDALSVGFTIAHYNGIMAFFAALIIAIVTFVICFIGLAIGKKFGTKLSDKAQILGGIILIAIGLEIIISGI